MTTLILSSTPGKGKYIGGFGVPLVIIGVWLLIANNMNISENLLPLRIHVDLGFLIAQILST